MKLTIELIPGTMWYKNLRNSISKEEWNRIRKDCYKKAGFRCEICGNEGKLNCHEVWEFNNLRGIQKLVRFIALCDMCHHIKHLGFVNVQINKQILPASYYDQLANHFMKINNASRDEFNRSVESAFALWKERSRRKWKLDFGILSATYKPGQKRLFDL